MHTKKDENRMLANYYSMRMKKEMILERLKENGCRVTKQRKIILDTILSNECSSCKEIYYKASEKDATIGIATVYRMINTLEEIGAIHPQNIYQLSYKMNFREEDAYIVELEDETFCRLTASEWYEVVYEGLRSLGYVTSQRVRNVVMEKY